MTVAAKVKQTLASLRGAQATIETFAITEKSPENRAVFQRNALRIKCVADAMEKRTRALELEEPQYKGL